MALPTKGSLKEHSFIQVLKEASESKLTGMIRVEKGPIIKVVYVQSGTIAFASSNEKSDRLTEVLKRVGKLTAEQIEDAQARLKPNVSLGKTLVELGYISPKDLLWGARAQVEGILHQLLFWNEGTYQILEGPLPKEVVSLGLAVAQVLYEGVLRTQDRDWVLEQIVSPQAVFQLTTDFHEKNAAWKLPAEEVVSRINGRRPLEEIAQSAGMDTFEVCKTVAALQLLGLVQRVQEQPIQVPLLVTQNEARQSMELGGEEVAESGSTLGQEIQIPTVEELQEEETEAEPEPLPQQPQPEPIYEPAPTELLVRESQTEEEAEESISFIEHSSVKEMRPGVPLFSFNSKNPTRRTQVNWRSMALIMGAITLLAIGGVMYYFRNQGAEIEPYTKSNPVERPPKRPVQSQEPAVKTPENTTPPVEQPASKKPAPVSQQPAPPKPATVQPPVAKPVETVKTPPPAATTAATPLQMLQQGKIPQAAKAWEKSLASARSRYTIQLEIACQEGTVREALGLVDPANLLVIPLTYHGQSCYRILNGTYPSQSAAETARALLPPIFLKQEAPARVVPLSNILK